MRIIIYPAKKCWNTARRLKEQLLLSGNKVLLAGRNNPRFKQRVTDFVINWGNSKHAIWDRVLTERLNHVTPVSYAVNKLHTFTLLKQFNIPHPEWTTDYDIAKTWKGTIVCRATLTGYGGDGISLHVADDLPTGMPLYVKYIKKMHEYRIHVMDGEVIDISQKKRKAGFEGRNNQIRNYANGWIYAREDVILPQEAQEAATAAVTALGLDFGAVDLIYNQKENKYYVLEVNTAPGLVGTTLEKYANNFNVIVQNKMPRMR